MLMSNVESDEHSLPYISILEKYVFVFPQGLENGETITYQELLKRYAREDGTVTLRYMKHWMWVGTMTQGFTRPLVISIARTSFKDWCSRHGY